jgi:cyclophilin family peptidyl-prolyl cis-trans isomerase
MKKIIFIFIFVLLIAGTITTMKMTGNTTKELTDSNKVNLETTAGNIVIELYPAKSPITVANFKTYVKEGFYDNTIFHRIIAGFMVQGGGIDTKGNEKPTHSPIKLESQNGLSNKKGTVAMARTNAPNSATAQFFINVADNNFLDYGFRDDGYAVFGKVISGMDVVEKMSKVKTNSNDEPLSQIKLIKASFV